MILNEDVDFYDCRDMPWCDSGGMKADFHQPCSVCGRDTYRWDMLMERPVCNDGSDISCSEILWREHSSG